MKIIPDWTTAPAKDRSIVRWQAVALAVLIVADGLLWWTM